MELDRRKTGIIIVAVAALIGITLLLVALMMPDEETSDEQLRNVYIEHPDAEVKELSDSKLDAYASGSQRSQVENYWDSIEDEQALDEDPLAEISGGGGSGASGGGGDDLQRLRERTEDRRTGQASGRTAAEDPAPREPAPSKDGTSAPASGSRRKSSEELLAEREERRKGLAEQTTQQVMELYGQEAAGEEQAVAEEPAPQEEPVNLGKEKVVARQSGVISSLDDGFDDFSSGGISSLDGPVETLETDAGHPFKCMFVREEKIESGQRVSVRLLEDMLVGNTLIPRNTHLMAVCTIGSRLEMKVTSIEMNGRIYTLNYEAYDNDGMKGIYCPDVDTQAKDQARTGGLSMGRRSVTKMGAVASEIAGVGITIAESVSNKRAVKVPQGYTFYLVGRKDY